MLHAFLDSGYWFAPKRYGYGAGLPIAWQGWVLTIAYTGLIIGAALLLIPDNIAAFVASTLAATVVMLLIAARKTRGGWRWRWGE